VDASVRVQASLASAERLWFDTSRWAEWVPGLETVTAVQAGWPSTPGACVVWRSGPAGRGTVTERVSWWSAGAGQRLAVRDDTIEGEQSIAFVPSGGDDGATDVTLALSWRRRRRARLSAPLDLLFVRRAMADALAQTLERFASALEAELRSAP
jgi:hypothetical protein